MILKTLYGLERIDEVDAICEARIDFNGKRERLVALASSVANTNALVFRVKCGLYRGYKSVFEADIFIGNLRSDVAEKYMETLGKEGYLDISLLDYQKPQESPYDYIFDNGASKPYICSNLASQNSQLNKEGVWQKPHLLNDEDVIPVEEEDESYMNMVGEKDEEGLADSFLPDFHSSNV